MRRFNALCASAVVALALTGVSAANASAAKLLEIKEGGVPLAKNSAVLAGVGIAGCASFTEGKLTANGASKDTASFKGASKSECSGATLTGGVTSVEVKSSGAAEYAAKFVLTNTAEALCTYDITKFTVPFSVPGETIGVGEATGKLDKGASSISCIKSNTLLVEADLTNEVFGPPFETELRG